MPDVQIENHGSVVLVRPLTAAAHEWIEDNIAEPLWYAGAVACEPRFVDGLAEAMAEELEVAT